MFTIEITIPRSGIMDSNTDLYLGQSVIKLIQKRTSVRTYQNQPLSDAVKDKLIDYFKIVDGPFNIPARFVLCGSRMKVSTIKLGTYGIIKDSPSYIIAAIKKDTMYMEELGFIFEKIVLYCTSLGLGTCWMGGTFKKGEFRKVIDLKYDEILPIVSPVGYPLQKKSLVERVMRLAAGSNNRKEFGQIFFNGDFDKPLGQRDADKYSVPLEMVRLAPSASNKQPWRIVKQDKCCHFYLVHAKGYSKALGYDIQKIDIGIAMCHFELTSKEFGIEGRWELKKPTINNVPENAEYIISWEEK